MATWRLFRGEGILMTKLERQNVIDGLMSGKEPFEFDGISDSNWGKILSEVKSMAKGVCCELLIARPKERFTRGFYPTEIQPINRWASGEEKNSQGKLIARPAYIKPKKVSDEKTNS